MKRLLFCILTLSILFTGCDNTRFKDTLRIDLKDAFVFLEDQPFPLTIDSGWLYFSERKSDNYWNIRLEIPNMTRIVLGPEHEYYQDGTHYLFQNGTERIELGCGETPFIWATFSSGSKLEFNPDGKTSQKIKKVIDKCIFFPPYAFPTGEVAVPEEAVSIDEAYAEVAAPEEEAAVEEVGLLMGNASSPRLMQEDEDGNPLLLSGYFRETKFYKGVYDAAWAAVVSPYRLDIFENEIIKEYSEGGTSKFAFKSYSSEGSRIYSKEVGNTVHEYTYNPKTGSLIYSVISDGNTYWCKMVSAGNTDSAAPPTNMEGNYQQQQYYMQQQKLQKEQMYMSQYRTWENTVISNYNSLMQMREGAARASIRMNFRNGQSQMRQIRQNALVEGIHIPASVWESASVPLGYE